jgi:hypothetical protein
MDREEDIEFLKEFRKNVEEYLFLGFAPAEGDLFPSPGWGKMKEALESPKYQDLRREINEAKGRAQQLLTEARVGTVMVQYPAPAVGGPILRHNLLDLITENRASELIEKHTFLDKIDEAIGKLRLKTKAQKNRPGPELSYLRASCSSLCL